MCLGTGYLTACFALMVGPEGRAVGVEHIPELVTSSIQNIEKSEAASLLKQGSLSINVGGMYPPSSNAIPSLMFMIMIMGS